MADITFEQMAKLPFKRKKVRYAIAVKKLLEEGTLIIFDENSFRKMGLREHKGFIFYPSGDVFGELLTDDFPMEHDKFLQGLSK